MGRCQAAGEKKEGGGAPYQKNTIFWLSCWRGPREPKTSAIVLIFRTAKNLSAEGERHGISHQLQQPIRRQRDAPPHTPYPCLHGFIHTPPPQPRTKTSRATRKRPPMSSVPISISGLVVEYIVSIDVTRVRFPVGAICPTLHLCTRTLEKNKTSIEEPTTPSHNIALYENSPLPGIDPGYSA